MKIKSLRVINFQSIKDTTFHFDETGVFKMHGKNNIGKSAFAKTIEVLVKNASNNTYKDYLRDECTFFSVEYKGWDGARVKLSRGSVDFYEWDLGDDRVGRVDKTSGKVPQELEAYFNLYHEKEKTDEILNLRIEGSRMPFVETTAGESYFVLQKALGTEEFLLATKKADQYRAEESKGIKLIETYARQEEERLMEVSQQLAEESQKLQEVERYENVLKAENEIYQELLDLKTSLGELSKQNRLLKESKAKIENLPLDEVQSSLEDILEMKKLLTAIHEVGQLTADKKASEEILQQMTVDQLEEDMCIIDSGHDLLTAMDELAALEKAKEDSLTKVNQIEDCTVVEEELVLISECKEMLKVTVEYTDVANQLKEAKKKEAEALQKLEEFKKEMGVCPVCGTDLSSGTGHAHQVGV